jgi:hypothetical protein
MPERLREATKRIDRVIQEDMRANSIHVASVGVVYDQELVWEKGYGLIDPSSPSSCVLLTSPHAFILHAAWSTMVSSTDMKVWHVRLVDSNTIMRVGSISKLITTVMLFQARDRGLISVDDPVSVPLSPYTTMAHPITSMRCELNSLRSSSLLCDAQKYVPELAAWPTPFVNNPGITWRALAGEVRYTTTPLC